MYFHFFFLHPRLNSGSSTCNKDTHSGIWNLWHVLNSSLITLSFVICTKQRFFQFQIKIESAIIKTFFRVIKIPSPLIITRRFIILMQGCNAEVGTWEDQRSGPSGWCLERWSRCRTGCRTPACRTNNTWHPETCKRKRTRS
jgi:hypothetical protein